MRTRNYFTRTLIAVVALTLNFLFAEAMEMTFDTLSVNETVEHSIIFTNTGTTALAVTNIKIDSDVFTLTSDADLLVESGEEVEITIEFAPENAGNHEATLSFNTNDSDNEEVEMTLVGTATKTVDINVPTSFELNQNYPNPFNPSTTVKYQVPENAKVNMIVYNMTGQKIATLTNEFQAAGYHNVVWNGTNDFGQAVASGVYFLRMQAGSYAKTISMTFTK